MWLLKRITLVPLKSMQAILETTVVLRSKDITDTFVKPAVEKACCSPEAWNKIPHQTEPGSNEPRRLLRAMSRQRKAQRVLGMCAIARQSSAHACPLPVFPAESEAFLAGQTAHFKNGAGFGQSCKSDGFIAY